MMSRKQIKEISRLQLNRNGNWLIPVILTGSILLLSGFTQNNMLIENSFLLSLTSGLVISLLNIFLSKCCLQIARSEEQDSIGWANILVTTSTFVKCILYSILISVIGIAITYLLILIGGLFIETISIVGIIICISSMFLGVIISIYSAFSIFIILDKGSNIFEAWSLSYNLIRGHFWDIILIGLSFILWYIFGILTFGIGMFWVTPYVMVTYINYYLYLSNEKYN
ncbi:DUF975 family protein [Terrisporobacter mayombei]|uniref:DUF975 domain-containing protein n=1 Tax=Terrisporobacter mayombei TaxID=1541 RepID=A0ABY9Q6M8_9FIRM|nr:DUF975 family protein [Terrisporobacter mayombei]MCC3868967.1 DUF975 family protein [Terrisporobacter mayombei]WMT82899.1 hypothetical protein TEMA_33960 [Terrisporobacter mayombei]